jgi:hypothetical protein
MSVNLNAEIEALRQMTVHELQDRYIDAFGEVTWCQQSRRMRPFDRIRVVVSQ